MMPESEKDPLYCRGCDHARVIQVIETIAMRGTGEPDQPIRRVIEYWSLEGKKLAEDDPYLDRILAAASKASSDSM